MLTYYELWFNVSKYIYNFFIFLSFRTEPQLEETIENNHHIF